ncbi:MAG: alpha/beta hydrolase [Planctomycetaceae bacterium]
MTTTPLTPDAVSPIAITTRPARRSVLLLAVVLAGLAPAHAAAEVAPAAGAPPACMACPEPDVWVVSTRRLPSICRLPGHASFDVEQRSGGMWQASSAEELLADSDRPLVFFIHGNLYEECDAKSQGVVLARRLWGACPQGIPPRVVVFSWPSQQQGRLIPSSRNNFRRSFVDGHYLARLLGQVDPAQPVALVGYSFGGTIAVGAVEDLVEAGDDPSAAMHPWVGRPGRTHLVLVAPAVRHDALSPRGLFAPATAGIDRLTLLINSSDLALKMFPHLEPGAKIDALGSVGMPRRWLPGSVEYSATDAAGIVGKRHAFPLYLDSATLSGRIAAGAIGGLAAD